MTELEHFVRHRFDLRLPVSYEDVRDFLQSRWGLVMNIGSLRQIVARSEALKTVDGEPLEDSRLFSSQEQIDGFGCHQTDEFLELASEANIICKFIPPHTSDQLQPLDLGVFGNQKRWQGNITVEADLNRQTKQVIKIYDSYRMATTPKNVIGAFRKAGLVVWFDTTTMMLMLRVDRQFATAIRDNENEMPTRNTAEERQRIRI